ncbi:MAG TPA: hypothetical protein VF469_20990 [Kofleriaceae bacterium]
MDRRFEAGTALEHLRAEIIDIEALARGRCWRKEASGLRGSVAARVDVPDARIVQSAALVIVLVWPFLV